MADQVNLGTCLQDCSLIAQTFERGAHSDMTELSVFAPLARQLLAMREFSSLAQKSLASYQQGPVDTTSSQLSSMAQGVVSTGTVAAASTTGFSFTSPGGTIPSNVSSLLNKSLSDWIKECIPCDGRLLSLLELFPNVDFLAILKDDLLRRLNVLDKVLGLLRNFGGYSDLCALLELLGAMCIPDLQRIVALLAVILMMDPEFELDIQIDIIKGLIIPLIKPIMLAIASLLDQFAMMILGPIDCIIDSLSEQARKLDIKDPGTGQSISSGIVELRQVLQESRDSLREKLWFYINQAKKVLLEGLEETDEFLTISLKKLKLVRFISFVVSIIQAISRGSLACTKEGKSPTREEVDNFFSEFLNPNVPYVVRMRPDGQIEIDTTSTKEGWDSPTGAPPTDPFGKKVELGGAAIIDAELARRVEEVDIKASSQQGITLIPCYLKTTLQDADKINRWIRELNQES